MMPPPHPRVRKYYYFYIIKDKNILMCILTFSFLMAWFTSEKFNCIKGTLNGRFWIPFFSLKPFTHNLKICMLKINHPKYYLGGPTALFRCPSYCLLLRLLSARLLLLSTRLLLLSIRLRLLSNTPTTVCSAPPTVYSAPPTVYSAPPTVYSAPPTVYLVNRRQ